MKRAVVLLFVAVFLTACGGSAPGSRIAFVSDRDGNMEIYGMNADGSNQVNLTNNPAEDRCPAWSP